MRRTAWTDLCGAWHFAFDDSDSGREQHWEREPARFTRSILVPFPPESAASGIRDTGFHPIVWYRRTFEIDAADRPPRLKLWFGAVDYDACVWINGHFVGEHQGGNVPFSFEVAHLLSPAAEQDVVVRAHDNPTDLSQPRGKQYWLEEPGIIWYHRTTGIWQPVWLEPLGEASVAELFWTPDLDAFGVELEARIEGSRQPRGLSLKVRLEVAGDVLADDICRLGDRTLRRTFHFEPDLRMRLREAILWSPRHPNLIEARLELLDADGRILDEVHSYFGMRSVEARDGRILLNGGPIFLRMALAQNYWPESHLAAPSVEAMRREIELAQSAGFNGLRIHQKIEDPRFLYWCDRLGMLVWGEMANAYVFTREAADRLISEWRCAVRRDYNHPSIIAWLPLNESWGVPNLDRNLAQRNFVKGLYHLTKAMDPTRPAIGNDGWQHVIGDILGVHDYATEGARLAERYGSRSALEETFRTVRPHRNALSLPGHVLADEPVMVSEFGGLSFGRQAGDKWYGYGIETTPEALMARYSDLVGALLASPVLAGFCYTQLADTEQESNGLFTAERLPKVDISRIRQINTRPAASVPVEVLDAVQMSELKEPSHADGLGALT